MFSIFSKASWWELFETYLTHGEPLAAGFSILAKFAKTFSVNFWTSFHKKCGQICQQKFSANFGRPRAATKFWSCQNQIWKNKAVWERDKANPVCQISFEMIRGRANTYICFISSKPYLPNRFWNDGANTYIYSTQSNIWIMESWCNKRLCCIAVFASLLNYKLPC